MNSYPVMWGLNINKPLYVSLLNEPNINGMSQVAFCVNNMLFPRHLWSYLHLGRLQQPGHTNPPGWDWIPSAAKRVVDLEGNNTNGTRNLSGRCRGSEIYTPSIQQQFTPAETDGLNFAVLKRFQDRISKFQPILFSGAKTETFREGRGKQTSHLQLFFLSIF